MSITVDIEKTLGNFRLNVQFEAGNETLALLGQSGCGKSLTLKCIAGIERPDRGRIVVDDVVLFDSRKGIDLSPQERRTGLMFQNYALFPHMTVRQNIEAGARREKEWGKRRAAVDAVMKSFGLTELAHKRPYQISGGEQQRVALARILVSSPRILLLDEPFSALDSHLRFRLEQEVREVIRAFGKTVLLVSHDRDEVFRMSQSIAVMAKGAVETVGTKEAVFGSPDTRMGAVLTGCRNISAIRRINDHTVYALDWGIELEVPCLTEDITAIGIRTQAIRRGSGENSFRCRVVEEIEAPFSTTLMLRPVDGVEGMPLYWLVDKEVWRNTGGQEVEICLPPESILLLRDGKGGEP